MRRRRMVRRRRCARAWLCVLTLIIGVCALAWFVDARLRPQLYAMAAMQACALQEHTLNSAVLSVLEGGNYGDLVTVEQNADGIVTSVRTDALKINLLKARISDAAEAALTESVHVIRIPIGSLTGLDTLAGAGPSLRIRVRMSGYAAADVESEFDGAGVNQTIHRLMLRVNAGVALSMPHNQQQKDLSYAVCIAETVIVGAVPNVYANMQNGE